MCVYNTRTHTSRQTHQAESDQRNGGSLGGLRTEKIWGSRDLRGPGLTRAVCPRGLRSGLISFRIDWLDLFAVQGTLKSLLQHHSSKASILWCSAFFMVQLSHACPENPRDGGAWWAAVYGVAQSWTQLKRLSSSSSSIKLL